MGHDWSDEDNLLVIDAYYRGATSKAEKEALALRIGVTPLSIDDKIKNIRYLDTREGVFSHTSRKIIPVWEQYCRTHNIHRWH